VDSKAAYGFFRERSHDLIAVDSCFIQNELAERCARVVTEFINSRGIAPYDEATGKGSVRHVFCRRAIHTGDAVVCIVSARGFGSSTEALVSALREACPELSGIVLNINKVKGNTVLSGDFFTLWGKAEICDTLCGLSFNIAPQAFYQINPAQAERLYNRALEYACPQPVKLAFDLYCGAGTISLCLARLAEKVIGAEIVPEAIENAKHNAAANGTENAEFICADAGQAAELLAKRGLRPEVIVVDPPRKGMDENAVAAVASMEPERIVYVSCNPATLARDVLRFNALGYELKAATAVDMFPRTGHVETVVLLSKGEIDSKKIRVEFSLEDLDTSGLQRGATYGQIKERVLEQTGLKVSSLYIAQVKQKCGIIERENYNKPKSEDARQPQCPPEKEAAIMDALRHFGMIQ
jgi:23S rRNA (uracil1939-C5)-methyltransferase